MLSFIQTLSYTHSQTVTDRKDIYKQTKKKNKTKTKPKAKKKVKKNFI